MTADKHRTYDADVTYNVLHYSTKKKVLTLVARSIGTQGYADVTKPSQFHCFVLLKSISQ